MNEKRTRLATGFLLCMASVVSAHTAGPQPTIQSEDVHRFYEIYDAAGAQPGAEVLQREYIDAGSDGLHTLARLRNVTGERIAAAIAANPALYSNARRCADALPRVKERLTIALRRLGDLYPEARFPPVTIAIGRGKPVGVGGPDTGVQIGLEALCAVEYLNPDIEDRFVYVIAHEFVHVQQAGGLIDEDRPTVLQIALQEGVAEFVTELIAGNIASSYLEDMTAGREKEIETRFLTDRHKTDLSDWVFNGTLEEPGDLGYWVGYRIAKTYYQNATDKRRALREILQATDADAFLAQSGWYPGIELAQVAAMP